MHLSCVLLLLPFGGALLAGVISALAGLGGGVLIVLLLAAPVALGVLIGALLGTRVFVKLSNNRLRLIFLPILGIIALERLLRGFGVAGL